MNKKTKVKLKAGTIQDPDIKPWKSGYIEGFIRMEDGRGYAVIQTEHGEFDTAPIYSLLRDRF